MSGRCEWDDQCRKRAVLRVDIEPMPAYVSDLAPSKRALCGQHAVRAVREAVQTHDPHAREEQERHRRARPPGTIPTPREPRG